MHKDLETTQTDCMCQEKKEKEDLTAFNITLVHQYNDSKTKCTEEAKLQPPEAIQTSQGSTKRK